jgi:hypothetical protein
MERRNENIHGVFKHVGEKIMKIINLCWMVLEIFKIVFVKFQRKLQCRKKRDWLLSSKIGFEKRTNECVRKNCPLFNCLATGDRDIQIIALSGPQSLPLRHLIEATAHSSNECVCTGGNDRPREPPSLSYFGYQFKPRISRNCLS